MEVSLAEKNRKLNQIIKKNDIKQIKLDLKENFVCKFKGAKKKYVGNKIDFIRKQ